MNKVSKLIRDKIIEDNKFSNELAMRMNIQQQSVIGLAKRNSNKLTLYEAVKFYMEKGYSENEIFAQSKQPINGTAI